MPRSEPQRRWQWLTLLACCSGGCFASVAADAASSCSSKGTETSPLDAAACSLLQAASLRSRKDAPLSSMLQRERADPAEVTSEGKEEQALQSAVAHDPTESGKWSLGSSAGPFQFDFCEMHAQAVPMCPEVQPTWSFFSANGTTATTDAALVSGGSGSSGSGLSESLVGNFSWVHLSSDGSTCLVKSPKDVNPAKNELVVDESVVTTASPVSACSEIYDDVETSFEHADFFQALLASGKASYEAYPFKYTYKEQTYNGSIRFAVFKPPVPCPEEGCQVLVYLHGLNILSQCGPWGKNVTGGANDMERLSLRPTCEEDYRTLRSIIIAPMLEPDTFPDAAPELITTPTIDEFWNFSLRVSTRYLWYSPDLDVFGDAVMPTLKNIINANAKDVDKSRVHLVGFSMGAVGAMVGAFRNMDVFASVTAVSPCVLETSHFPGGVEQWMPAEPIPASRKRMQRILLYIGEDDNMYLGSATECIAAWSQLLGAAKSRGHISASDHLEIHYLQDPYPHNESTRTHSSAFRYAMSEMDALFWRDTVPPLTLLSTGTQSLPVPGCSVDLRWLPLVVLVFMAAARVSWSIRSGSSSAEKLAFANAGAATQQALQEAAPEGAVDLIAGAKEAPRERPASLTATAVGHLKMTPRWLTSFVQLISPDAQGTALLGCSDSDSMAVSFPELRRYLAADCSSSSSSSLPQGLRYAIVLPAGREFACVLLSVMNRGTAAPLDPTMTVEELCPIFAQLRISAVICREGAEGEAARAAAARMNLPVLHVTAGDASRPALPGVAVRSSDAALLQSISKPADWDIEDVERVVLLLRTSGTTSKGKVVPFGFRRLAFAAQYNASCVGLAEGDVCLSMMPLFHIAGISVNLLPSLVAGSTVLLLDKPFDAPFFLSQLERKAPAPTWYFAVPAVHKAVLLEAQKLQRTLEHRLRLIRSAGAALEKHLGDEMLSFFNVAITPCYGMTEACEITCPPREYRLERGISVGPPMTCTIKIDTTMDPKGGVGEVCVKGDLLMRGYEWTGPSTQDPNNEVWTEDGFLRTGDVGYLDEDGWLYLTGRTKEMINRGGETLSPYEVEDALQQHPSLAHVLGFAAPHSSLGECIAVACVLKPGCSPADAGIASLHKECHANGLRKVMWPEVVIYVSDSALPKTRTKKYIRTGLATKLGLSQGMLAGGARTFVHDAHTGELMPEQSADEEVSEVQDSMMQSRRATRTERVMHNMTMSLYGIVLVNVMLNHWLPHSLESVPVKPWVMDVITTFRSDKALMGLMFILSGNSVALLDTGRLQVRAAAVFAIYFLMGWPLWSAATASIATFQRWFLLYLGVSLSICLLCRLQQIPPWAPTCALFLAAPLFASVPDEIGQSLAGFEYSSAEETKWALLLNSWFYWSIGHKIYWAGFFALGFFYGPRLQEAVWSWPASVRGLLSNIAVRGLALCSACLLAYLLVETSVTYKADAPPSLSDWPEYFSLPWYPVRTLLELLQLVCLVVAVGEGGLILQAIGNASLATFVVHMYIDTGIWAFITSRSFQELDWMQGLGPLLQLTVIFAYPICFGLTVGPLVTWLVQKVIVQSSQDSRLWSWF